MQLTQFVFNDAEQKEEVADIIHRIRNLYTNFGRHEVAFQGFVVLSFWHQPDKESYIGVADLLFNIRHIYLQKHDEI